ncbi:hypothetical protein [Agrobacterium radiobacter]|uniref:hypothetical protein n=1 Tax=Agrobacterium radiobacter TaxID=362 RepID=UPI003CEBBBAF
MTKATIDDGGPAFPCEGGVDSGLYAAPGMSLRQYYAGQALVGICANPAWNDTFHASVMKPSAEAAVAMADALIAALKEGA